MNKKQTEEFVTRFKKLDRETRNRVFYELQQNRTP